MTSATAVNDDPQRQLDVILSALYRDIGMLSSSLAVVSEEHNGIYVTYTCTGINLKNPSPHTL